MVEKVIREGNIWDVYTHQEIVSNNGYVPPLPFYNGYLKVVTDNWDDRIPSPYGGEFYYNFSGSGYISVKLTNLGNYIASTGEEIDSALCTFNNNFKVELYNNTDVLISSVDMAPVAPATSSLGPIYSTVNISVPNAGLYYLKIKIGSSIGYYAFYNIKCAGNSVVATQLQCDWELYVKAVEYVEDGEDVEENIPVVFPKTIFNGYVWDCHEHVSDIRVENIDGIGSVFACTPYPHANGYLLIDSKNDGYDDVISSRGNKYYLWNFNDGDWTRGIITRKRNPLTMEMSDIIGQYIIDGTGAYTVEMGFENMTDADGIIGKYRWVSIVSDRSNGYDELKMSWYYDSNFNGVETLTFVEEITDLFSDGNDMVSSNSYYYNFSNSGYIDITITNNLNCIVGGDEIYSGRVVGDNTGSMFSRIELYDIDGTLVSSTSINKMPPATINGEEKMTVTIGIPKKGLYYIKCYFANLFYGMKSDETTPIMGGQLKSYWSIYVNAVELSTDIDRCVSFNDYLNYWYEKSGRKEDFHPNNISVDSYFKIWDGLDSKQRVLWNDGDNMTDSSMVDLWYNKVQSLHYHMPIYKNDKLNNNQLIRVKDIPNFNLFDLELEMIYYPDVDGDGTTQIIYSDGGQGGWLGSQSYIYSNSFSSLETDDRSYVYPYKIYYDPDVIDGIPRSFQLLFTVINSNQAIITESSYTPTIDVTFGNGYTYTFNVVSKTYTGSGPYTSAIAAMCNNTEGFKIDEVRTIRYIDYSGLHFTTVGSSQPEPEQTYYKLYYLNYWIGAGTNKRIYLSESANDLQIKSYSGDFISLDGLTTYAGNVPFDIVGSGTNTYLKFSSNNVSAVLGRDCYFRVACGDQYSGQTIYPCFRVVFNSNGVVNMINTRIGDCTLWMGNSSAGNSIYMGNRSSDTSLKIYPLSGAYTNGKTVGGYLYNTFAHGFFNGSSAWSNFTLNYISDAFATIDAECAVEEVVSLISPRCSTFTDIITYMYMAPSVDVSVYS